MDRKRHARPQAAAREAVRVLRGRIRRDAVLAGRARGRAVRVAFQKMSARDGRKALQVVHGKDQRLIHQAVNQQVVLGGIDIGRLVAVSDHEVQRGGSDVTDRILNRIPPPEILVISRRSGVVQARGAEARGSLESRALAVAMQILREARRNSPAEWLRPSRLAPLRRPVRLARRHFSENSGGRNLSVSWVSPVEILSRGLTNAAGKVNEMVRESLGWN